MAKVYIVAPQLQYLSETYFGGGTPLAVELKWGKHKSTFLIADTDSSSQIQL